MISAENARVRLGASENCTHNEDVEVPATPGSTVTAACVIDTVFMRFVLFLLQ